MTDVNLALRLAQLTAGFGNLPIHRGEAYAESAAVLLVRAGFHPGVEMALSGESASRAAVHWDRPTAATFLLAQEVNETVKEGASGIALLLAREAHGWDFLMFSGAYSVGGNGIDFYVGPPPFKRLGSLATEVIRVEATGIGPDTKTETIENRLRAKRRRLQRYSRRSHSMIAVVDFRIPRTAVEHAPQR